MKYHYEVHYTKSWWVPLYRWAVRRVCNVFPVTPDERKMEMFIHKYGTKQLLVHRPG